jgi:glyoxylase-like metal-dependent hydrolase (beta-lactamase superfamily II)/rhodanese-related sulfurtransferase
MEQRRIFMIFRQLNNDVCKTYLIADEVTREAVLIDPVIIYTDNYIEMLKKENLRLAYVIDTHTHADHISAGPSLLDATGCGYVMYDKSPVSCVTKRVKDGDTLKAAGTEFKFLHTPGHTKDSLSVISESHFFTGDFLFLDDGGAGRDDLPGGNPSDHWESFQKLRGLSDELIVFPAHDYRDRKPSKLGHQKDVNPFLEDRSKSDFVGFINDLKLGPAEWMHDVLKANVACSRDPEAAYIPKDSPACEVMGTADPSLEDIEVNYIDAHILHSLIEEDTGLTLLDVRDPYELNDDLGHIKGIINVPVGGLMTHLGKLGDDKSKGIVVICRSGARAGTAAKELTKEGFTDVSVLLNGMMGWRGSGY